MGEELGDLPSFPVGPATSYHVVTLFLTWTDQHWPQFHSPLLSQPTSLLTQERLRPNQSNESARVCASLLGVRRRRRKKKKKKPIAASVRRPKFLMEKKVMKKKILVQGLMWRKREKSLCSSSSCCTRKKRAISIESLVKEKREQHWARIEAKYKKIVERVKVEEEERRYGCGKIRITHPHTQYIHQHRSFLSFLLLVPPSLSVIHKRKFLSSFFHRRIIMIMIAEHG